ncbi:MAG: hypothetical protein D6730_20650 [Bacteroidetes bacterium]|nr:MAG: hypothetical protein D6730_20650 [Bacteroidota bacterium]
MRISPKSLLAFVLGLSALLTGCDSSTNASRGPILACTLSSSEQIARMLELKAGIFSQCLSRIEEADGYVFVFKSSANMTARLIELIQFERQCCSAFTFTLKFLPEGGNIHLKIGNSPEIKAMVKAGLEALELE